MMPLAMLSPPSSRHDASDTEKLLNEGHRSSTVSEEQRCSNETREDLADDFSFKSHMNTTTHNDSIEGLRGIAVLLTQICHISVFDYRHLEFFTGKSGVAIFFVLSGYLITGNLLKLQARYSQQATRIRTHRHLARFYMDRAVRLLPALLAMMLVTAFFERYFKPAQFSSSSLVTTALVTTFYMSNFAQIFHWQLGSNGNFWENTWSLAVEEQFYIFWSFVLPFLVAARPRSRAFVFWLLVVASFSCKYFEHTHVLDMPATFVAWQSPFGHVWKMLLGAALHLFPTPLKLRNSRTTWFGLSALLCLHLHAWYTPFEQRGFALLPIDFLYECLSTITALLVIIGTYEHRNSLLCSSLCRFFGRISYSWYLYQLPLLHIEDWPRDYRGFSITGLALVCASGSTILLEEPTRIAYRQWKV